MSEEAHLTRLRARADALRAELESEAGDTADRDRVRAELIGMGREIDVRIAELEALKEALREAADRYRERYRQAPPRLRRRDHLGGAAYRERGWSALAAGDNAAAIRALRRALELDVEDSRAVAMLAWAFALGGQEELGAAVLEELTEDGEPSHLAAMVAGLLELRRGRLDQAVDRLTRSADGGEDATASLYAHLYLGVAYGGQGREREAQRVLRRALELGPNLTEALWELGQSHLREGRTELAREAWRAGGENRFNVWGERCRAAVTGLERGGSPEASP